MRSKRKETEFFVSADGNDNNPGTIESPFATLSRARDAVREIRERERILKEEWETKIDEQVLNLPLIWKFRTDPDNEVAVENLKEDDYSRWGEIRTDKSWTLQGYKYLGTAWYSLEFSVPKVPANRCFLLHFGAVDGQCWIWINGKLAGSQLIPASKMWNRPFDIDVSELVRSGSTQRLIVKVVKETAGGAGIWKPVTLRMSPEAPPEPPRPCPVTVWIRGGKYYPECTFHLTAADSGTEAAPTTYAAYPGETPVISGGRRVTDWKHYKNNIYVSEIPETRGRRLFFRQLYVNGQRQVRARYPKEEQNRLNEVPWNRRWAHSCLDNSALESWQSDPRIVWNEPDAFPHYWAKPAQGELLLKPAIGWGDTCLIGIRAIDPEKRIIRIAHGTRDFSASPFHVKRSYIRPEHCLFIIENLLEELTEPGEWCLDTEDGYLYFWPPDGTIDDKEVVIPVIKTLVHMEGVSHVCISGIIFTETLGGEPCSHYPDVEGVGPMSARLQMGWEYCGESIYMYNCTCCRIEKNRIVNIGGNGVYMHNFNERNLIRKNEIAYAGANGIVVAGSMINLYEDLLEGSIGKPHPQFNEITDNSIHHVGLIDTYAVGVFLGMCNWNRVAHNHIFDVPHIAVTLGNSSFGRNCIEYNRIARAAQAANDTGAINCWHELPHGVEPHGHIIRYNLISDTGNANQDKEGWRFQFACGIYLDNWSSNCLVYGNILVNHVCSINVKGKNNIIQNNIFINSGRVWLSSHCSYPEHAAVLSHNIFYNSGNGSAFLQLADRLPMCRTLWQCDNNLFFRKGDNNPIIAAGENIQSLLAEGVRFSEWRRILGRGEDEYDTNSAVGDPLFRDVENGDYSLKPESPAFKLGFQPIDTSRIGIRGKGTS